MEGLIADPVEMRVEQDFQLELKTEEMSNSDGDNEDDLTLDISQFAECNVFTPDEIMEFNSTDAMLNPFTNLLCCLHCLKDVSKEELQEHMMNEHGYRTVLFNCYKCNEKFKEREIMLQHRSMCKLPTRKRIRKRAPIELPPPKIIQRQGKAPRQPDPVVTCDICLLQVSKYYLRNHMENVHHNTNVLETCCICGKSFKSKMTLKEHIKFVHQPLDIPAKCELCGQEFKSKKYLSNHKRNVHPKGDKIHKCNVCGKEFKAHLCLHQHMKYVHPPESASAKCPRCPKVFKTNMNLQQHVKQVHEGIKKGS